MYHLNCQNIWAQTRDRKDAARDHGENAYKRTNVNNNVTNMVY